MVLGLVMQGFSGEGIRAQALRPPFFAVDVVPPAPRLQGNPGVELILFKEQELKLLNHYGWINKEAGIARIPIDRAMDILARKGLPEPAGLRNREQEASPSESKKAAPPDTTRGPRQETQTMRIRTRVSSAIVIAVLGDNEHGGGGKARRPIDDR